MNSEPETAVKMDKDADAELSHFYTAENLPLFESVEDLRWKVLIDRDGEKIGTIETVEVDEDTCRVEFLQIGRGGFLGFGAERFLVPVTHIVAVDEKTVKIDYPLAALEEVPQFEFERLGDAGYLDEVRSWWSPPAPAPQAQPEPPSSPAPRTAPAKRATGS